MTWTPRDSFCCLIGAGDSGKSTILDAVEAELSSRWFSFSKSDFLVCDTSNTIEIEATVGQFSKMLKSGERFGLHIRGWRSTGELRDEPEDDDEVLHSSAWKVHLVFPSVPYSLLARDFEGISSRNHDRRFQSEVEGRFLNPEP